MRAFTYLRLVTWFGDVPFFTTNPTLPESRVVKVTPAATIKEFIHSELAEVAEILPKNTDIPESENGRYTRGTAVALNARAYLYDNDFENCAIWCDKLINSTEYGTYALEQDYKKLFHDQSCCYGPESMMTIEFATLGGIDNIVRSWNNFNAFVPQSIGNKGVSTQSPTQELVDTYRKLDGSVADDTDYEKARQAFTRQPTRLQQTVHRSEYLPVTDKKPLRKSVGRSASVTGPNGVNGYDLYRNGTVYVRDVLRYRNGRPENPNVRTERRRRTRLPYVPYVRTTPRTYAPAVTGYG